MMSFRNASNINASHSVFVDGGDVYQTIHNNTTIEAVIHLTGSVTSLSHDYVGSVHGARKEMMQLFAELGSLDAVLKMLQKVLERSDTAGDSTLGGLAAPLDECKALLGTLKVELTPGSGVRGATASLTWPLKMEETKKCLSRIERAKSVFILAMTSDQIILSRELLRYIQEIRGDVEEARLVALENKESLVRIQLDGRLILDRFRSENRGAILKWLSLSEPETSHMLACSLRQSGTGKWFLEGEEFLEWEATETGCLWLYAIPGAGKTILMSTIIDFIAYKYLTSTPGVLRAERIGAAFFYFDFKDSRKQTTLDMLGSLLSQLCQQLPEFPEEVANLYNTLPDTSRPPLLSKLQEILPKILLSFSDTFVLIDALDECTEIECLLKCISWLCHSSQAKFHIMTSSRSQPTIEEAMTALRFNTVSIQQQSVDADVGLYVTETIAGDKRLRVLDDTIKEQVTDVLIKGSHGMFRWVKAQLDSIRSCRTVNTILSTLETLPKTLDETYEHILVNIRTEEDRRLVRRALHWLVLAVRPLTLEELAEAIVVDVGSPTIYNRLFDPKEVLDLCGSLVIIQGQTNRVGLAHYSVQEYLVSERITQGPASNFSIRMLDASADMVSSCLTYLQLDDFDSGPCVSEHELENRLARFPLLDYAATSWFLHVKSTQIEILIRSQASKLLQRERTLPFLSWLQVFCNSRDPNSNSYEKNRGNALYYLAEWGFCSTAEHLIQLGSDVDGVQGDVGYPLHAATHGGHEAMVRLLLENGADVTLQNDHGDTALHLALAVEQPNLALFSVLVEAMAGPKNGLDLLDASGRTALHHAVYKSDKAFRILLQAGASAEPKSHFEETPLFSSLRSHNQEVALELLKYGADPHRRCWSRQTTPMHMAARRHYTTVMEAMLLRVMSVNITDSHGVTPLHDAIGSENDTFGTTPWTERGDAMVDLLLRHNADVTLGKLRPRDLALARSLPHCIQVLSNYEDRCLDTQDEFGYTALHFAAQKSREGVRSLLGLGASVNIANNSGMTPLHFAAQNMRGQSETDIARDLEALETGTVRPPRTMAACDTIICLLVAAGANIHVRNLSGEKPLDILRRASRKWGTWRQNPELHHEPK